MHTLNTVILPEPSSHSTEFSKIAWGSDSITIELKDFAYANIAPQQHISR